MARAPGSSTHVLLDPLRELGRNARAAGALRQPLRECLAVLEVGVDDDLLLASQRLADRLGVHVGIAVHVAADPGSEMQHRRAARPSRPAIAVNLLQRLRDLLVERRNHAIQDLDQIEQHVLALVRDSQLLARMILRLPTRRQLDADAAPEPPRLVRCQCGIEPVEQMLGDALLLAQDGLARGLGRDAP